MYRPVRAARVVTGTSATALPALIADTTPAWAHGEVAGAPELSTLWTGWSFDVEIWLPLVIAAWLYLLAVRSVDGAHPGNPVPRRRLWAWLAGLAVLLIALQSPIERYDTTLFSVHMVQHLLLMMVAAPLLLLAAPVTLLLRVVRPPVRRGWVLPVLHSRPVRFLAFPVVAWVVFALVTWAAHFTPLFDAALENSIVHYGEHALFLGAALLFWWPALGVDPTPWRLPQAGRIGYLALGMPLNTFLALAIFSATSVLYPHYATLQRDWGMSALEDQAWAGGIMWVGGDLVFLVALVGAVGAWLRAEEAEGRRVDALLDRQRERAGLARTRLGEEPPRPG
jgi:putative copper resistance protein D